MIFLGFSAALIGHKLCQSSYCFFIYEDSLQFVVPIPLLHLRSYSNSAVWKFLVFLSFKMVITCLWTFGVSKLSLGMF